MVLLVPFDGSPLSKAALARANEFGGLLDEEVIALAIVPPNEGYARERGWVEPDERFSPEAVADRLESETRSIAPETTFRRETTDDVDARSTPTTDVVRRIREVADDVGASILFIGSENAGRVTTPVTSVGNPLSEDPRYDVHIVRHPDGE